MISIGITIDELLNAVSVDPYVNRFPHPSTSHINFFSPSWTRSCFRRLLLSPNRFPQILHSSGFSPEWTREWTSSAEDVVKRLSQMEQMYGRVLV